MILNENLIAAAQEKAKSCGVSAGVLLRKHKYKGHPAYTSKKTLAAKIRSYINRYKTCYGIYQQFNSGETLNYLIGAENDLKNIVSYMK